MSFERAHNATSRADQTTVRRANLGIVLRRVAAGPCSRAEVAADTGLTRGTVSSLVDELVDARARARDGRDAVPRGVGRPARRSSSPTSSSGSASR